MGIRTLIVGFKAKRLKKIMKKILVLVLTLFTFQSFHAQFAMNNIELKLKNPPNSSYTIVQTKKKKVKKIAEYDTEGRLIFDYRETEIPPFFNWKEPHRFIYAKEFDSKGRVTKRYDFNSNAGLSIYIYEYQGDIRKMYELEYTDSKEKKINTNSYAYINKIQSFSDLVKSKEVANILNSKKRFVHIEKLNKQLIPTQKKRYSERHKDTLVTSYTYNSKGKETSAKVTFQSSGLTERAVITNYPKEGLEETEILNYRNGKKSYTYRYSEVIDEIQNTKTSYSERNKTLNIRHSSFDENGLPIRVEVFETPFQGKLVVPISKVLKKTAEIIYSYNEEGLLKKEVMTNYKTRKKDTRKYQYKIFRN